MGEITTFFIVMEWRENKSGFPVPKGISEKDCFIMNMK